MAAIVQAATALRGFIGLAAELNEFVVSDTPFSLPDETAAALHAYVASWLETAAARGRSGLVLDGTMPSSAAEAGLENARLRWWELRFPGAEDNAERAHRETVRGWSFVNDLRVLADALVADPILIDTGQWDPAPDRPRSYADMAGEIASRLVSLQKYEARCRLLDGDLIREIDVRTPSFRDRTTVNLNDSWVQIRDRSRTSYCLPLAEVLEKIANRRGDGGSGSGGSARRQVPL